MTARTSEKLAQVLESVGLHDMAALARMDHYHDYLSDLDLPSNELEQDLRRERNTCPDPEQAARIEAIRRRHINDGEFDADKAESDEWAASADGQASIGKLTKGE